MSEKSPLDHIEEHVIEVSEWLKSQLPRFTGITFKVENDAGQLQIWGFLHLGDECYRYEGNSELKSLIEAERKR